MIKAMGKQDHLLYTCVILT